MTLENSKPEWFQMADADPVAPAPTSKRVLRLMALATPLLVLGAGLVFAQTQDSPIAVANAATKTAGAVTPAASAPSSAPAPAAPTSIVAPGIKMPTQGGGDGGLESSSDDD